jgi:hypothetical protein
MTFSSLHAHALPLYTSFGLDAWWPLLYLHGAVGLLPRPENWRVTPSTAAAVAAAERRWTGLDRTPDHLAWAAQPGGRPLLARLGGELTAAGTVTAAGRDRGIVHLAVPPGAADEVAAQAVLTVLASLADLAGPAAVAQVCLPAPHPAVRLLLAAGWRSEEFDLFMATEPGLLDPRRAVPSPGQA